MEIFKIVKDNKPSLRQRSENVEFPLDPKLEEKLLNMIEYLRLSQDPEFLEKHHNVRSGVGLAAPQIGVNKNMLAISFINAKGKREEYAMINPRIISESVKECYLESGEGCLSVDKVHEGFVYRHYKVTVKTYDLLKKSLMTYTFTGYPAIIVQHEIDHLKGVLFYDHINKESPFIRKSGAISI